MSASWDLSNDFAVFDGAESVTLRAPHASSGAPGAEQSTPALRRAVAVREVEASHGKYVAGDVRWHFPSASLTSAPVLGSTIVDSAGRAWTILEIEHETLGSRWRCTARAWEITAGLNDLVSLYRARWTKTAAGVPTAEWIEVRRGAAARVQPLEQRTAGAGPSSDVSVTHRCFIAEPVEIAGEMRLRCGDALYEIRGLDDIKRLERGVTLLLEVIA